jgi:hypothetical protein
MGVNAGPETRMSAKLVESLIELSLIDCSHLQSQTIFRHVPLVSTRVKVQIPLVQRKDDMIAFEGMCAQDCGLKKSEHQLPKIEPPPRGLAQLVWNSLANEIICVHIPKYQHTFGMF